MVNIIHSSNRTFFDMNSGPEISLKWELENCSPTDKKVVLLKQSSKHSNSRKAKTFLKDLGKNNQGSECPGFSRWLCNTFSKETFSIKDSFPIGNKSRTTKTDGHGSGRNVEEGGNKTSQFSKGRVLMQFVPCKTEGWGQRQVINLKHANAFIPYKHFKMEGFVTRRRLYEQARPKGCILLCPFTEKRE